MAEARECEWPYLLPGAAFPTTIIGVTPCKHPATATVEVQVGGAPPRPVALCPGHASGDPRARLRAEAARLRGALAR